MLLKQLRNPEYWKLLNKKFFLRFSDWSFNLILFNIFILQNSNPVQNVIWMNSNNVLSAPWSHRDEIKIIVEYTAKSDI